VASASVRTFTLLGIEAREVVAEVDVAQGLPSFSVVGLPDTAVRESRERVRAAIANSGFTFPQQRITASLAPANLRKGGPGFDLAIAAALLACRNELDAGALAGVALAGELALDGTVRAVPGVIAMAERAAALGIEKIVVATESAPEAALPAHLNGASSRNLRIVPVHALADLRLLGTANEPVCEVDAAPQPAQVSSAGRDLADLRGQPVLRRALELAAAGGHGLLILGPPGAGKSLAARCLPTLLPPLSDAEALEVLRIASACGRADARLAALERPFRAPHHTVSTAGLIGGSTPPRPGEVTLAHRGVLFLDELGEFTRDALEGLRQPLEDGEVTITRAAHTVRFPSRFLLVAASNTCPCGRGPTHPECECPPGAVRRYQGRISGALADRIDLAVTVEQPAGETLAGEPGEPSVAVRGRVIAARERAAERQGGIPNGELDAAGLRRHVRLTRAGRQELARGYRALGLSGRGHDRVLRVARTIADLADSDSVDADHIAGALAMRRKGAR
jgi:magnesium chelatase family protein